ncbi:MAG: ABC transporter permease, partial [Lactobacillus iners]|nr:ABC transporter permease [Lactobacillus iners]
NGLVAVCGALIAQSNGYADINMGLGTIVIALASIIIGEVAFGELTLNQRLVAVTLGSILYRLIILCVLQLGFSTNDLNLLSSIVLAICMMIPRFDKLFKIKKTILRSVKSSE